MERIKWAASAAQARETVVFRASQLAEQRAAGVPVGDLGKGIGAQVALARRESPSHAARLVGLAEALVCEMPATMAALTAGTISEWRATLVARETACLSREDRREVDARVGGRLATMSDKQVLREARKHAYELDPQSVVARGRRAVADRRVTIRPAPDTMAVVSALLPAAQGVAVYAALTGDADSKRAHGDDRSRGQVMADTLVERVTGQTKADQTPVEVRLVMTDRTLLAGDQIPARLDGYGPIPAPAARALIRDLDPDTKAWLRRLFLDPCTGLLTAMDPKRRLFKHALRRAVVIRDEYCRTPWCGAPIRHIDHVIPAEDGGVTSETNGQGLCEACNHAKQAPGWRSRPGPGGAGDSVTITTPTGHAYTSRPPPLPGAPPEQHSRKPSRIDVYWAA
ncbi:MAG: HNH endonuclease [Actinomycetota bacterium]|nr:HNH endonuclease [Actinomycetota bacterium]